MINLLPYEQKKQIRAARANVSLVRYLILVGVAIVFLAGVSTAVYLVLLQNQTSAESATKSNETKENTYSETEQEAATFRTNLATTRTVLLSSVSYSNVMVAIANALPAGVVIDNLTLSPTTIGVPITLDAHAKNNADALLLKQNFSASPLFSNVSLQTLSVDTSQAVPGYPIAVTISLTINKAAAS